ncbi:MAG: hypothetical protein ACYCV7_04395 [Acidimicrobiales bacterium]
MGRYDLHGLHVESAVAVGLPVTDRRIVDLDVRLGPAAPVPDSPPEGELLVELPADGPRALTGVGTETNYVLRIHRLCDFILDRALREIECRPDPDGDPEYLGLLLGGSVLAFLLGLSGECVLHASTVEVAADGSAIAFAGAAGTGKSTLAGLACASGARFIADDLLRVVHDEGPEWIGGAPELRLRPGAVESVGAAGRGWATRCTVDGRVATVPPRTARSRGPLRSIVLPRPSRTARAIGIERLSPLDALLALAHFPRLTLWRSPSVLEVQFDGVWRLASTVPVFIATIPWGPPFPEGLGAELLRLVGSGDAPPGTSDTQLGADLR